MSKLNRYRSWVFILYPESAPENWKDYLNDSHIGVCISPLHCNDIDGDGVLKKAHYHICIVYGGPVPFNNVCEFLKPLNCTIPQKVMSLRGTIRYFIHLDDPDKFQYDKKDLECLGGFDIDDYFKLSASQIKEVQRDITLFCKTNNITEFSKLVDYCMENNELWFEELTCRSYFIIQYLKSKHFIKNLDSKKESEEKFLRAVENLKK